MELKLGKCKGMTVEQVLKQQDGGKLLAGHLAFIEKGFDDPKWGQKNKEYHAAIKAEWSRITSSAPSKPSVAPAKSGPSDSTKLDILNKQLHDIAKELKKLDDISDLIQKLDAKIKLNHEAVVEVENLIKSPDEIQWEE